MLKNNINTQFLNIKQELIHLSSLYSLHIVEVVNIFNNSLIKAYKLNNNSHIVNLNTKSQLIFHNIFSLEQKIFNLSKEKFNHFYKIFNKNILIRSDINIIKSFYNSLSDKKFVELKILNRTRKYLKLIPINNNGLYKNLIFIHKISSKSDDLYINNNKTFWITINNSNLNKISNLKSINKSLELSCNIMDTQIIKLLINHFLEKIKLKTNNKISIKVKFYNHKNKIINLVCSEYIPILFIKYIEDYVYKNTYYKTNFSK